MAIFKVGSDARRRKKNETMVTETKDAKVMMKSFLPATISLALLPIPLFSAFFPIL
jgi:hypothetical protein